MLRVNAVHHIIKHEGDNWQSNPQMHPIASQRKNMHVHHCLPP